MPTILKPGIADRRKLRNFLEEQLKLIEKTGTSAESNALVSLLRRSIEGLVALDYGESQLIFAQGPRQGSKDGSKPYTLRKLRMKALGFAGLLIANNYEGEQAAIRTVASAYGQKADAFRGWRKSKRLGKTSDPLMKSFREEISKLAWDKDYVLAELKKARAKYLAEERPKDRDELFGDQHAIERGQSAAKRGKSRVDCIISNSPLTGGNRPSLGGHDDQLATC